MGGFLEFRGKNGNSSLEGSVKQLERRARRLAGNNQNARFRGANDAHITVETRTVNKGWFGRRSRYTKVNVVEGPPESKIFSTVEVHTIPKSPISIGSFTKGHIDAQGTEHEDKSVFGVDKGKVEAALATLKQTRRRREIDAYGRTTTERLRDNYIAIPFRKKIHRLIDVAQKNNATEEVDGQTRIDFRQIDRESNGTKVAIITGKGIDGYFVNIYSPNITEGDNQMPDEGYFIPSTARDNQQILYQVFNLHYLPDGERSEGDWEYTQVARPEQLKILKERLKSLNRDLVLAD